MILVWNGAIIKCPNQADVVEDDQKNVSKRIAITGDTKTQNKSNEFKKLKLNLLLELV